MDMNNLRTESHVAQKNRRHKLRFQQNSDDPTHHHQQHFEVLHRPRFGSISYDPNVFPTEMLHSIATCNPHLLLPPNHSFPTTHDQDSGSASPASLIAGDNPQNGGGNWKTVVTNDWNNVVSYNSSNNSMSIDQSNSNSPMMVVDGGSASYAGDVPYNYQNTLQGVIHQNKNFLEINNNNSVPCWMNTNDNNNHNNWMSTQGLSLSLSSVPQQPKPEYRNLHSDPKQIKFETLPNSDRKQLMGMSSFAHRNVGPLGPFTGYATILKNSKYLKPAQELLNDNCDVGGQDLVQTCDSAHKILEEEMSRVSGESSGGASSSTINYGSNEHHHNIITGRSSSLSESYRPDFHHKKATLLYMQEEVCRRYKQYHQQMQMVISSFETVAGLTSATPYVSLALKSVSRHFHFVKNAISEQLSQMKKTFEDLCSPSKTFDANNSSDSLSQLKSMDHNFHRHGKSSGGAGYLGSQQPVWRPQRGLPERAVSVLKAWLFDHFLHPYPSDADKHMLATQTGLTRNQVSNWFINARVRIWKPMVEEIHTLETKGLAELNTNNPRTSDHGQDTSGHINMGSLTNKQQPESSRTSGTLTMINGQNEQNEQLWDHEKRSRPDFQMPPATMDRSYTNIMPYPRTTFEAGGVGPVSLTLGLRQNAEHVQQLQQHEHQLRQRFGGQLIHDFVG